MLLAIKKGLAMAMKDPNRVYWNENHKRLREALAGDDANYALDMFLKHHAMVHSANMAKSEVCNFADEVWDKLSEDEARLIPPVSYTHLTLPTMCVV